MRNTAKINHSDEQGFTLLEVMVAGAIGLIVAFSIARVAISASRAQRLSELDLAQVAMLSRLQNAIDDPTLCPSIWKTWNVGTSVFDPAIFDPAGAVTINQLADRPLTDGALATIAKTSGPAGGPTVGVTMGPTDIQLTEPFQVSDNTYDWTLTITTTKVLQDATPLPAGTSNRKFRIEVTTTGSPNYTVTSCGPPVSPAANQQVAMLRFTAGTIATTLDPTLWTDTVLDAMCSGEFTSVYSAASLQELVAYKLFLYHNFGGGGEATFSGGQVALQFNFTVADMFDTVLSLPGPHIFTNAIDPAAIAGGSPRPEGTIVDVKRAVLGDGPHVACIRNTAPMRFVRGFYAPTDATKTAKCKENIGFAYEAAHVNDLLRFGFRLANNTANVSMDQGAPGAVFEGPASVGIACRMGWDSAGIAGPGLDCGAAVNAGNYPIACVLR